MNRSEHTLSISKYTHKLKANDGKPVFVVRTPVADFTGKRWGVTFINGEAKFATKDEELPRRFDEELGYEVVLPDGYKPWKLAGRKVEFGHEYDTDSANAIEDLDAGE